MHFFTDKWQQDKSQQVKKRNINNKTGKRTQHKFQKNLVDSDGIDKRIEMRALVIFQINRLDRKFLKRNLVFFGAEKHIHLVFKALALCGGKIIGEKFTGHAAKAGLRIRNRDSAEEFDDAAGHFVAKAAAPWDFRVIKLTAS